MKNKVTFIQVKEGKVYASGEEESVNERFKQSFIEVSNPEIVTTWPYGDEVDKAFHNALYKPKDGLYPISGMVMQRKVVCNTECGGLCGECKDGKIVCTISLEPVEQKKPAPSHSSDLPDVREEMPIGFLEWYSGTTKERLIEMYESWKKRECNTPVANERMAESVCNDLYYCTFDKPEEGDDGRCKVCGKPRLANPPTMRATELKTLREENERLKLLCGRFNDT